jgi:class 3 adenylate cyclase/predicted ATPase
MLPDGVPQGRVTLVFTDIVSSYSLTQELGDKYRPALLEPHNERIRERLAACHGHEVKTIGDAFMLAFHTAPDALQFSVSLQRSLAELPLVYADGTSERSLHIRIGIHTSVTDLMPDVPFDYIGREPNLASRIEALAGADQILISDETRRVLGSTSSYDFREWPRRRIKGSRDPETVWECLWDGKSRGEPGARWYPDWFKGWATPFVARPAKENAVADVLAPHPLDVFQPRLVTIFGAGGMGKTRLAVSVAIRAAGLFKDGVWFIDLSDAHPDADAFLEKVSTTLSRSDAHRHPLSELVCGRELLLVLDNYETVACEAVANVIRNLIDTSSESRVLVTGREIVGLDGYEQIVRLDDGMTDLEAIELLTAHIRLRRTPGWEPAGFETEALRTIATETEAIPLAMELAAAWTRNRSLEEVAAALTEGDPNVSTAPPRSYGPPARHRSLRRCAEWSIAMLSDTERDTFARLSILDGDAHATLITEVCETNRVTLDRLCDASLVIYRTDGAYGMHRYLRAYARERLGETAAIVRERLLAYWLARASRREAEGVLPWAPEHDLNHVLAAALTAWELQDYGSVVTLSAAFSRALLSTGLAVAAQQLSEWSALSAHHLGRHGSEAWSYFMKAQAEQWQGRSAEAEVSYRKGIAAATTPRQARALQIALAALLQTCGRPTAALAVAREAVAAARLAPDREGLARALDALAALYRQQGDIDKANGTVLESAGIRVERENAKSGDAAPNYLQQGMLLLRQDPAQAIEFLHTAVALWAEAGDARVSIALNSLGEAYRRLGKHDEAEDATKRAFRTSPDARGRAYSLVARSRNERERGALKAAQEAIEEACSIYSALNDVIGELSATMERAQVLRLLGDLRTAEVLLKEVVARATDVKLKAIALDKLGELCMVSRRFAEAEEMYSESLRIFQSVADQKQIATVTRNLQNATNARRAPTSERRPVVTTYAKKVAFVRRKVNKLTDEDQFAVAERYLLDLQHQSVASNDIMLQGIALNELGAVRRKSERLDEAKATLLEALQIFANEQHHPQGRAATLHKLGDLFTQQRAWVEGEEAFRSAMRLKLSIHDKVGYGITLGGLAVLYRESHLWEEGRAAAREAHDIMLLHGTSSQVAEAGKVLDSFDKPLSTGSSLSPPRTDPTL